MTKRDKIQGLTAQIQELERAHENFIQQAYEKNKDAIAGGDISSTRIHFNAHVSFPDSLKIERMERELDALLISDPG